jgi:hypothetical protein
MHALGRQVENELFDGDGPIVHRIVGAEHGSQRPGANLMKNTVWSKRVRWRRARSFGWQ